MLLSEIELQCGFALKGYGAAAAALERRAAADFWYSLQALVAAVAHLHRLLAADAQLRAALRVAEKSSLLRPELDTADDIRAALPCWMSQRTRGPLRSSNFGPSGLSDAEPAVFARYIDLNSALLTLFGITYDLPALLAAVAELGGNAKAELSSLQKIV